MGVRRGWTLASGGDGSAWLRRNPTEGRVLSRQVQYDCSVVVAPYSVSKNERAAAGRKLELLLTDQQ